MDSMNMRTLKTCEGLKSYQWLSGALVRQSDLREEVTEGILVRQEDTMLYRPLPTHLAHKIYQDEHGRLWADVTLR